MRVGRASRGAERDVLQMDRCVIEKERREGRHVREKVSFSKGELGWRRASEFPILMGDDEWGPTGCEGASLEQKV